MLRPWCSALGLALALMVLGCAEHRRPTEPEPEPEPEPERCEESPLLRSADGEWVVSLAKRSIGALHIDATTCRFEFEPATDVPAGHWAAASVLPFVANPRGRVEELRQTGRHTERLRFVAEAGAGGPDRVWDLDVRRDRPGVEWMQPVAGRSAHLSIRHDLGRPPLLPCQLIVRDTESPLGGL